MLVFIYAWFFLQLNYSTLFVANNRFVFLKIETMENFLSTFKDQSFETKLQTLPLKQNQNPFLNPDLNML